MLAEALQEMLSAAATASRYSVPPVELAGPMSACAPSSMTTGTTSASIAVERRLRRRDVERALEHAATVGDVLATAKSMPRVWPWNSDVSRPCDGAMTPTASPSPVSAVSVGASVSAGASLSAVVSSTEVGDRVVAIGVVVAGARRQHHPQRDQHTQRTTAYLAWAHGVSLVTFWT